MSGPAESSERVQEILAMLLKQRLGESLERAHAALEEWRSGRAGAFEAHAQLLAHVARADRLAAAMSRNGRERTASLLRAAFDAGLVEAEELRELTGAEPGDIAPPEELEPEAPGDDRHLPAKPDVVKQLLDEGTILVHVDARRPGVSVPDRLAGDPRLVLRFGYGLSPAIVDLEVGEDGLSGVLSFSGAPHRCVLPWPSIYAVVSEADQRGMLWPSDVPPEAVASVEPEQQSAETKAEAEAEDTPARRSRGHLKLVD